MNTNENLDCLEYSTEETAIIVDINKEGMFFKVWVLDSNIKSTMTERDDPLYKESCFEIFFDPDSDGKNYYEIEINPRAAIFDYILRDADGPINANENMVEWHIPQEKLTIDVEGTINDSSDVDKGWTFTLDIPWDLLAEGPPKKGSSISFNFMRVDADDNDKPRFWVYHPTGHKIIHVPDTWPKVYF